MKMPCDRMFLTYMSFHSLFNLRLRKKRRVIVRKRSRVRSRISAKSAAHYLAHKKQTRNLVEARILHFLHAYKERHRIELIPSGRIAIRNTKSRWGSCSSKKNLNFSYKLCLLPAHLSDYIVAHELCHLKEFNHSQNFWNLLALEMPEYHSHREELKKYSLRTI